MTLSNDITMQQKRGLKANLPASAPAGQLLVTTDTNELFVGTGTSVVQVGDGTGSAHQTTYTLFEDIQSVYADGMQGLIDPKAREGWYFTNQVAGQKINWYYYDPQVYSTTVSNLSGAYAICTFDTNKLPFFTVYTTPTGSGDFAPWYKSARVYTSNASVTHGTTYVLYFGTDPGVYEELPRIELTVNPAFLNGSFGASETIYLISFHTDSGASVNTYKFVTHQLGFQTSSVSREYDLKIKGGFGKTFTQATAAATWTINHYLGRYPSVTTVDTNGYSIEGNVRYVNANQITVEFNPAVAGTAYLN